MFGGAALSRTSLVRLIFFKIEAVSLVRIISGSLIEFVGPGVDERRDGG
jgi:hypothetical protein